MTPKQQNLLLPWIDAPLGELLRLGWPITVSMLSYSTMTLASTLFVGRIGPAALAGVGVGGTVTFALACFSIGVSRGGKVVVAQAIGAGRRQDLARYLGGAIALALLVGVFVALLGQVAARCMPLFTASVESGANAQTYVAIRSLGAPMMLVFAAVREHRYGSGDSRSPMMATLIGNAANILFDWILIVLLDFGVAGAAWGAVLGHTVEMGTLLLLEPSKNAVERPARAHLVLLWRLGWPTGLQFLLEVGSFLVLAMVIAGLSETEMASHQIAIQVIHFTFLPAFAVSEAASVMVGQAVGAERTDQVRRVGRWAAVVVSAYGVLCMVVLIGFGHPIAGAFSAHPAVQETTVRLLLIAATFQLVDGIGVVARGALRGTGDVRVPAVIGIVTAWVISAPGAWLFGRWLGLGATGAWIALTIDIAVGSGLLWLRLERNGWLAAISSARLSPEETLTSMEGVSASPRPPPPARAPQTRLPPRNESGAESSSL